MVIAKQQVLDMINGLPEQIDVEDLMYRFYLCASSIMKCNTWESSFYDHVIRKEESLLKVSEYVLHNPLRRGLVKNGKDYPYAGMMDRVPL